jgi:hypothetical protein
MKTSQQLPTLKKSEKRGISYRIGANELKEGTHTYMAGSEQCQPSL